MAVVTALASSWLGYERATGRLFFWDGKLYRPLEEAAGYATTGDLEVLGETVADKVDKSGGTMTGSLIAAGFSTAGTAVAALFELGGTRLSGDGDDLYVWGFKVYHQGNDGAGSGLDADQLDGHDSGYFTDIVARLGYTPFNAAGGTIGGNTTVAGTLSADAYSAPQITLGTAPAAQVLTADANGVYVAGSKIWTDGNAPAGRLKSMRSFIANGTWTKPAGVRLILVYGWGGGGGGGGAQGGASNGACGGGGGAGAFCWKLIDVSAVSSVAVTIGAGGAGGSTAGGNGGTGGATSFGSYFSCAGGVGGSGQSAGNWGQIVAGGYGGNATGGDFNFTGGAAAPGIRLDYQNGIAGRGAAAALLGGGGNGYAGNSAGQAGIARGDGGGGGVVANSATGRAGGTGATGMVWVWEFA